LSFENESVELAIEDNGRGFAYSKDAEGFGILGMQKRARGIGSTLDIMSTPGRGTKVHVKAALPDVRWLNRLGSRFRRRRKGGSADRS
jgi:signal transduction histidine kinase